MQQGKAIIDAIGLKTVVEPTGAEQTDAQHRVWREAAIKAAEAQGLQFTHGVAAKLINVYLKARRLGGPDQHPPIELRLIDRTIRTIRGELQRISRCVGPSPAPPMVKIHFGRLRGGHSCTSQSDARRTPLEG